MHLDNSDFIDIRSDDYVSEAVKLLIENCLHGEPKATAMVLLQNAVNRKENELLNADQERPVPDEGDAIDNAMQFGEFENV